MTLKLRNKVSDVKAISRLGTKHIIYPFGKIVIDCSQRYDSVDYSIHDRSDIMYLDVLFLPYPLQY